MSASLKRFGKYLLLDHLAQGGMAEIYRARMASADGGGRLIVIKKMQAGFGENQEFLQMFKSEIKVTMGFNHPNIGQLYDFGEEKKQPYIAMELIDGKNLRQFITRFHELKKRLPIELAVYIIEQSAAGLHYAHTYRDKLTGNFLNIVHRDISPQNILISYEGNVKVIDFGIAKATTNTEATQAGVIKGKPSYLSPEQIAGEVLDGRSDVFALGAVLWETLTGKKLFSGDSDLAILKLIEASQTHVKPPSSINPEVSKELDDITLHLLTKKREDRFQSAEEVQRALHKFLYANYPEFNPSDLSYYAKDLFKDEIVEDRKKLHALNAEIEEKLKSEPLEEEAPAEESDEDKPAKGSPAPVKKKEKELVIELKSSETIISKTLSPQKIAAVKTLPVSRQTTFTRTPVGPARPQQSRSSSRGSVIPVAVAVCILAVVGATQLGIDIPVLSELLNQSSNTPAVSYNPNARKNLASVTVSPANGAKSNKNNITLRVNVTPGGGKPLITLQGKPFTEGQVTSTVAFDSPLELVVNRPGFKPFQSQFSVDSKKAASLQEWVIDAGLEPIHFGFLSLHATPNATATINLDGAPWVFQTPTENMKIPVGNFQIRLENQVLGMSKTVSVKIEESKSETLEVQLDMK
jgi:serine/threonine-protein kinase